MRYVETTIKIPVATTKDQNEVARALEHGVGAVLFAMGRTGNYWSIFTEDPTLGGVQEMPPAPSKCVHIVTVAKRGYNHLGSDIMGVHASASGAQEEARLYPSHTWDSTIVTKEVEE